MKKKIFGGVAVLAIAAIAIFNLNISIENGATELSLANIEALAQYENNNPVNIPCCPSVLNSTCTFPIITGNGNSGTLRVDNAYRCD